MIIIIEQFSILHNFVNNIQIKLNLLLKHFYKNKINILALLLILKYKCSEH